MIEALQECQSVAALQIRIQVGSLQRFSGREQMLTGRLAAVSCRMVLGVFLWSAFSMSLPVMVYVGRQGS